MAIENLPEIRILKGDFLRHAVAGCGLEVQGLYFRIRFVMSDSERYGYLQQAGSVTPPGSVARRCGVPLELYETLLQELLAVGAFEMTRDGIIFCPEMVEQDKRRRQVKKRVANHRHRASTDSRNAPGNGDVTQDVTPNEDDIESEPDSPGVSRGTAEKAEKPRIVQRRPDAGTLIVALYPLKVKIPMAVAETELALARLRGGELGGMLMSEDDAYVWLQGRVKAYAASPEGKGAFAPNPDTWMRDKRYLDDEEAWYARDENRAEQRQKQSVQQAGDVLESRRARRMAHGAGVGD